ncbi:3-deoxy-7-phosphoheptulonate synthase [bacterium]|nr:3-deoxy-7-phosphoheptulonate synthase [bacterium]MBU1918153.1 3-deoxy-7-phosphoheptulonate synthase [bacterium]
MLIVMKSTSKETEVQQVMDLIVDMGLTPLPVPGSLRTAICITGNKGTVDEGRFLQLNGVKEVIRVTKPYKLVSREVKAEDTVIEIGDVKIGGDNPVQIIAGPCSVESEEQTVEVASALKEMGISLFRAGAFKPRTNPYDFQGFGKEGLTILSHVREKTGMKVVSEVIDTESVSIVYDHVDILQVGTRSMQNFSLLKKLSKLDKPIMLKRGMSASFEEWMNAAEYVMMGGNHQVILCERGLRTFSQHSRNTLDLSVVPLVKSVSHLPIIVDPSHGVGRRDSVRPMARASVACGAHALLIEAHTHPEKAYSDKAQTIDMEALKAIMRDVDVLGELEQIVV